MRMHLHRRLKPKGSCKAAEHRGAVGRHLVNDTKRTRSPRITSVHNLQDSSSLSAPADVHPAC